MTLFLGKPSSQRKCQNYKKIWAVIANSYFRKLKDYITEQNFDIFYQIKHLRHIYKIHFSFFGAISDLLASKSSANMSNSKNLEKIFRRL
jgi:hypothetical protein